MMGNPRDPRQVQRMMRQLGMTSEPVDGVDEVIVRTGDKEHVFAKPEVTIITVGGVRTYQVIGTPKIRPRTTSGASTPVDGTSGPKSPAPVGPPEEDVELVMQQAGVSRDEALEALFVAHGAPAEAILSLLARRGKG